MKTKHRDEVKTIWRVTPTERRCITKAYCKGNLVFEDGRYKDIEQEYLLMVFSNQTSTFYIDDVEYTATTNGIVVKIRKNSFYSNARKTNTITLNSDVLDFRYNNELWMCIYGGTPSFAKWPSGYTPSTTQKNNLTNFKTNVSTESKTVNVIIPSRTKYCWGVKSGDTERYFADYELNESSTIMGNNSYCSITVNYPDELQIFYGANYSTLQYHQLKSNSKYNVMDVGSSNVTLSTTTLSLPSNKLDLTIFGYNNNTWWNNLSPIKELEQVNWKLDKAKLVSTSNFPSSFVFVPVDEYGRVLVNIQYEYSDLSNTPRFYWRHGIKIGGYFVDFWPYKSSDASTVFSGFRGSCCVVNRLSLFSTFKQYDKMRISLPKSGTDINYPYWNDVVTEMKEWSNSDVEGDMLLIPIKLTDTILTQLRNKA